MKPPSPYLAPGFYEKALAAGRHRDIVGGRWDETPRIVLPLLAQHGLTDADTLLDIGAGALRLGRHLAAQLPAGQYWGTDLSRALMLKGWETELDEATRRKLPQDHLVEDADFTFPTIPDSITVALAFAVFTHLPADHLSRALANLRRFPALRRVIFTVFLAPEGTASHRQADGVVTHADRFPWHMTERQVLEIAGINGLSAQPHPHRLPRGQVMFTADPT